MRRSSSFRPQFEVLEDRSVPTTALFSDGVLRVSGTEGSDTIKLRQTDTKIVIEGVLSVNSASVLEIIIDARGGNDTIETRTLLMGASIHGGSGHDTIFGTAASDYLFGDSGNDRLMGMDGDDSLHGDAGDDRAFGMNGTDFLYGEDGDDFLDDGTRAYAEFADGGLGMDWNADVVAVEGTGYHDIQQRGRATCGFLSTLSGLARNGYNFADYISYAGFSGMGKPFYNVSFWNGSVWTTTSVSFGGTRTGHDPNPAAEGESWVIIMQRAWIKFHGNGGRTWPHQAAKALTGSRGDFRYSVSDADFDRFAAGLANNQVVTVSTVASPNSLLIGDHAYTLVATEGSGSNRYVQMRNPWSYDGGVSGDDNPNDGLVWIKWSTSLTSMRYSNVV